MTDCPECRGTGEVKLFRTIDECVPCSGTGQITTDDDGGGVGVDSSEEGGSLTYLSQDEYLELQRLKRKAAKCLKIARKENPEADYRETEDIAGYLMGENDEDLTQRLEDLQNDS